MTKQKIYQYVALIIVLAVFFTAPLYITGSYYLHILIIAGINIVLAISLRTIYSTGQLSMGHIGFMAIGAYVSALLMMKAHLTFWETIWIAGIAAAFVAFIFGYLIVRVKRVYFTMLTLFLGQIVSLGIIEWRTLTGGSSGLLNIPAPTPINLFGLSLRFNPGDKVPYYYLILVIVIITVFVLHRIDSSRVGKSFLAVQQGDSVAESIGIDVTGYKVLALCIGCFFAGVAGSFYASYNRVMAPGSSFGILQTIFIVVYMVVGGRKNFWGAIVGAFILTLLPEFFRDINGFQKYQSFVYVGILFAIIFLLPGGLVDLPSVIRSKLIRKQTVKADAGN